MSRVSTNDRDIGVPFIAGTANRNFMTEKDLVESRKPVGGDANKNTKQMNLFFAINQALHTALESDPSPLPPPLLFRMSQHQVDVVKNHF